MRKCLIVAFSLLSITSHASSIEDGKYFGKVVETGGKCSITFEDGYAFSRRAEYRLTVHSKGPFIKCEDYSGKEFAGCASGGQTNAKEDKSLYILLDENNSIEKIYFQDEDNNSMNDRTCINLKRK